MEMYEMRNKLKEYCMNRGCTNCSIHHNYKDHRCGRGFSYFTLTDEEVVEYFNFLFLDKRKVENDNTENCGVESADNVNHPKHYEGSTSLECIECMRVSFGIEAVHHFCLCNAFKYLWRYKNKNGEEDVKKARWYLDYVQHDIERDGDYVSYEVYIMYERLNNLYIGITDKITNME